MAQLVKNPPSMRETWVSTSLGWEDPQEKGIATPVFWPGEFPGLYSPWRSWRVGHDWVTFLFTMEELPSVVYAYGCSFLKPREPWGQSAIQGEAYLLGWVDGGRNYFQNAPEKASMQFSTHLPLGRVLTFQRQTPPERALQEVITESWLLDKLSLFFLLDSDPGIVSPLNPR